MRSIALSFFLLLAASAMASATSSRITLVHKETGDSAVLLNGLAQQFANETGIHVELTYVEMGELRSTLLVAAQDRTLPDVVFAPADFIGLERELELSEIAVSDLNPSVEPSAYDTAAASGKILGAPITMGNHMVLYYNKSLVAEPVDDLEDVALLHDELLSKGVAPLAWNYGEMFWFLSFAGAFGVDPIEKNAANLDTPQMQGALDYYKKLTASRVLNSKCDYTCVSKDFTSGSYA
jgi:ABC-type glycerol-3-phosphate transport system substrate-binding protein